ncbi:DUF3265 domain-containing protein [Vibrio parahaemolyticus]|nr:DUF3265 domain-containing protein [Vibrio vulnificus]MBE3775326.1 DUF3265 domain-containing protein [Vibrio parahaemolyticus]MBE4214537.1 DUF3265 domain-containing protein [Vibrio parahaemolyticus]MBE4462900.1 DUF3265 domain-containing protein [Vibrio parahaemolyticus]
MRTILKSSTSPVTKLTNCLRVIRNAWHFYYALICVIKVVCGGIGIALLTP